MKANKQDADKLVPIFKKIEQEIEGIKFATKDNFDQLLLTDNYLEKYLPFRI